MKILKRPNTQWSYKHTCTKCTAELEIEKQDVKCQHYSGDFREPSYDTWTAICPICSCTININASSIPKAVQVEIKNKINLGSYDR